MIRETINQGKNLKRFNSAVIIKDFIYYWTRIFGNSGRNIYYVKHIIGLKK